MSNIHSPSQNVLVKCIDHNNSTGGANTATYVDCAGYTRAQITRITTTAAASTLAACPLQECATSGGSYANVGSTQFPSVVASKTRQVDLLDVDLTKRLEFPEVTVGAITGTVSVSFIVHLYNGEGLPVSQDQTVVSV